MFVGRTDCNVEEDPEPAVLQIDECVRRLQCKRLADGKVERDEEAVAKALELQKRLHRYNISNRNIK